MFTCPMCNSSNSDGVRCSKCNLSYCFSCSNISEVNYRKLGATRQAALQCTSCKSGQPQMSTMSPVVPSTSSPATLDLVLQELRSGINGINTRLEQLPSIIQEIKNLKENLRNLEVSVNGIKKDVSGNSLKLAEVEERINILENQSPGDAHYPQLQLEIAKLSKEILNKDQILRLNNAEIKGIPITKGENLFEVVSKIGNSFGQHIDKSDINFITRARSTLQPKPIIVGFLVRYKKDDFVAAARSHKPGLTAEDVGFKSTSRIFVNDHLTKESKQLLTKAKKIAEEKNIKYVWVQNSKILARKNDTSPIIPITSDGDLSKMK